MVTVRCVRCVPAPLRGNHKSVSDLLPSPVSISISSAVASSAEQGGFTQGSVFSVSPRPPALQFPQHSCCGRCGNVISRPELFKLIVGPTAIVGPIRLE